jgi:formate hydrogenlyase subunit 4
VRWLVVTWLVSEVFAPVPLPSALAVPVAALKMLVLFAAAGVASALLARLRVDFVRAFLTPVALLMAFAIGFALIGA